MGRYATANDGEFKDAPVGTHTARCIRLIDLGTHENEYEGKVNIRNQIVVGWELPDELMDDGQPYIVHKFYTNSLGEKASLRADLEAWRGRPFTPEELSGFDLMQVLGKCCLVSVIAKASGKGVKVGGLMSLPKGQKVKDAHNEQWAYWIDEHDEATWEKVPEGFRKLILKSFEKTGRNQQPAAKSQQPLLDDDVPF